VGIPISALGNPSNGDETGASLSAGKENQRRAFPAHSLGNPGSVDQSGASTLLSKCTDDSSKRCNQDDTVSGVSTRPVTSTCSVVKSLRPTNDSLDSTNVLQSSDENMQCPIPWLSAVPSLGLCDNISAAGLSVGMYRSSDVASRGPFDNISAAGLSVGMYRSSASSYSSVRGPIILQSDSQCFTYSLRRYSAAVSHADTEGNSCRVITGDCNYDNFIVS